MVKVISVVLQKGGVGKTTTSAVLLKALHKSGYRVLGIDIDAQSQFTRFAFDVNEDVSEDASNEFENQNIYNGFLEGDLVNEIINVEENLDFIPGTSMVYSEASMFEERDSEPLYYFRDMLEEIKDDYDFIIIDTSPRLGQLETAAMIASDYLIIPVTPEMNSKMEVNKFMKNKFSHIKEKFNPDLEILGIYITRNDNRISIHRKHRLQLQELYPEYILRAYTKSKVSITQILEQGRSNEDYEKEYFDEYKPVLLELFKRLDAKLKI